MKTTYFERYFNKQFCIDLPNSTSSAPASEFVLQEESFLWSATSTNLVELANVTCLEILNFEGLKRTISKEATNKGMKRTNDDNKLSYNKQGNKKDQRGKQTNEYDFKNVRNLCNASFDRTKPAPPLKSN